MKKLIYPFIIILSIAACNHQHKPAAEGHSHDENLQLTAYSDVFEVYGEATPFAVGRESEVLAHFSTLSDFKPLPEGTITAILTVGTKKVEQTLSVPTKAGIYTFALTPNQEGTGTLTFDITSGNLKSTVIVPNLQVYTDTHKADHTAADNVITGNSNCVAFTKEQSWKVDFATEQVRVEPFGHIIKTSAQVQPSQGDESLVTAKASGVVLFADKLLVDGLQVNAGQPIFRIKSSDMTDNNMTVRYTEALGEYQRTKVAYESKLSLAEEKIVSANELLSAKTDFENAKVIYDNLSKHFTEGGQTVTAPISGFIKQLSVRTGEYVEAGQPLAVISQNRNLLIRAEINPKYYGILSDITAANIKIPNSSETYNLYDYGGKIVSFAKAVSTDNPLIPVTFQINNSIGLLSGSFVEMYIKTKSTANAITVDNRSLVEEMGNYFVYRQLTPELFEKVQVKPGATDGRRTHITAGLSTTDRVVTKGSILVKLSQSSGALDPHSGHAH